MSSPLVTASAEDSNFRHRGTHDGGTTMTTGTRRALEALPSLVGMSAAEARAALVLGVEIDADEAVALAGAWLGAGLYTPALCDLAASDWDDPHLDALFERALDELGVAVPSVTRARESVRGFLERRTVRRPATGACTCTCGRHGGATPPSVRIPAPRTTSRVVRA